VAGGFTSADPVPLRKGSEGDLLQADGSLDQTEATTLLNQAYNGIIDDNVLDNENVYFSMVFDCGYPADVKTAISTLCQTRRDCVGILDNGDNSSANLALATRNNVNTFNNYFVALYESYNKVFDSFTGQDVWFSPVYHMSYILPRNDTVAELWFAAAGFNRAAIDTIKELRYNPRLGQRDQLYLKQLNPIVKFNPGYVVWGQLTSQARASALQDLNIVRLVLYIKRAFEDFCKFFIFEQNDAITWSQVSGRLVEFLEEIKKKRGLNNFTVEVGATDYERRTKRFHVNVTLDPTRTVEQIELNFFIV
jgi:phage tail sheath protein FI